MSENADKQAVVAGGHACSANLVQGVGRDGLWRAVCAECSTEFGPTMKAFGRVPVEHCCVSIDDSSGPPFKLVRNCAGPIRGVVVADRAAFEAAYPDPAERPAVAEYRPTM